MCIYVCVSYVNTNKFAIVVIHYGPLKKKKKNQNYEASDDLNHIVTINFNYKWHGRYCETNDTIMF